MMFRNVFENHLVTQKKKKIYEVEFLTSVMWLPAVFIPNRNMMKMERFRVSQFGSHHTPS
jgi:hypothetical protein